MNLIIYFCFDEIQLLVVGEKSFGVARRRHQRLFVVLQLRFGSVAG